MERFQLDEKTFLGVMDKNIPITQATVSAATGNYFPRRWSCRLGSSEIWYKL